jgi:hypothetical protein
VPASAAGERSRRAPRPAPARAWLGLFGLVVLAGCAAPLMLPPETAGTPAPEAASAWAAATGSCRGVHSFAPTLHVSGRVGGERVPGLVTILGGLTAEGGIRLQASAPGTPVFVLAGTADRATLLLEREDRVLRAPAADIVEALMGIRVGPRDLLALFSGCLTPDAAVVEAARYGRAIWITTAEARVMLVQAGGSWQIAGGRTRGLLVEYVERTDGRWPKTVRLRSLPGDTPEVGLTVTIETFMSNTDIDPRAFEVTVPADATPVTLEELRAAGPLKEKGRR